MNDYYFDREEALYEMYEDSLNTFEEDQEDQEDDYYNHPSLSAADRNPSLRWPMKAFSFYLVLASILTFSVSTALIGKAEKVMEAQDARYEQLMEAMN